MNHASLGLEAELAGALMEAALAADRELRPPGPELDAAVARVLGVGPDRWRCLETHDAKGHKYTHPLVTWSSVPVKDAEPQHPPYSTDPAASDKARRLARKELGSPFVIWDQPNGPDAGENFIAWIQTESPSIDEPDSGLDSGVNLWVDVDGRRGCRGETEAHAVALAIVAAAGEA